jgi:acetyltransferase
VARLLAPKAVAVVGASRTPGSAGHEVFRSLLAHGFDGPVYPVNPEAPHVLSVRAYADVRDVPDDLDLAIIAVPAAQVADAVRACSQKKVRGLVVVSGGFADAGVEGRERLAEVVKLARDGGMRLIGPNAMGLVNTDPKVSLHATFAPGSPPYGRVGVFTQSGALASTFLAETARRDLGISSLVSIGDRADVSGNDVLQYWQADEGTEVVMLHLQGFGNPRKFARIARLLGRTKPVVCLKSGRARGDAAVDALFASAGVIRVGTLAQLFETSQLLALQSAPEGRRVGIVGTSSALAALAADACRADGLEVPELSEDVRQALRALAGTTETANPVDLGPLVGVEQLGTALRLVAASGEVDAVLALVTPHALDVELGQAVLAAAQESPVPFLANYLGHDGVPAALALHDGPGAPARGSVPSFASPESAARALARAAAWARWRARPHGEVPPLASVDAERARTTAARLPHDGTWLSAFDSASVLAAVGIGVWESVPVDTLEQAHQVAGALGWPVVLKSGDAHWRNRTDMGAVQLGLATTEELAEAWATLRALVGDGEVVLQRMAPAGVSTVVRLVTDDAVGPLLSLRLGGAAADLLADPHLRTLPLTDLDAVDLVQSIRGASLLEGTDVGALQEVLLRVARLAEEVPLVSEVLLDPVLVGASGVTVLHAGVRLLPPGADPESGPRRLFARGPGDLR